MDLSREDALNSLEEALAEIDEKLFHVDCSKEMINALTVQKSRILISIESLLHYER